MSTVQRNRPEGSRALLAQAFLKRSVQMLERLSDQASHEALQAALSAPSDIGGVASLLSDMAPLGVDLSTVDPLAEAMARGAAIKRELLEEAGGGLTSSQVGEALGLTRQGVDKRRSRRSLLGVPSGSGDYLYPACQFTEAGVLPGLEEVLRAFEVDDTWTQLSVLMAPTPIFKGKSALDLLRTGDAGAAARLAAGFGEQGA